MHKIIENHDCLTAVLSRKFENSAFDRQQFDRQHFDTVEDGIPKQIKSGFITSEMRKIYTKEHPMKCLFDDVLNVTEKLPVHSEVAKGLDWNRAAYVKHEILHDRITLKTGDKCKFVQKLSISGIVVAIPTRPGERELEIPKLPHPVVLVVEADSILSGAYRKLYKDTNIFFLILPPPVKNLCDGKQYRTRGIGFARQVTLTAIQCIRKESENKLSGMFFVDDDVNGLTSFKNVRIEWTVAMSAMIEVANRLKMAVVGAKSDRHRTHGLSEHYITYSVKIDFRFVFLCLSRCTQAVFQTKQVRTMSPREINYLCQMKEEWVQNALFQGEDFGFCEHLAVTANCKPQSVYISNLFVKLTKRASVAGTKKEVSEHAETLLQRHHDKQTADTMRAFQRIESNDDDETDAEPELCVYYISNTGCKFHKGGMCGGRVLNEVLWSDKLLIGRSKCAKCFK